MPVEVSEEARKRVQELIDWNWLRQVANELERLLANVRELERDALAGARTEAERELQEPEVHVQERAQIDGADEDEDEDEDEEDEEG